MHAVESNAFITYEPYLMGNALQMRQGEVRLIAILPVVLLELIQISSEQLTHKEQMFLQASIIGTAAMLCHLRPHIYSCTPYQPDV